MKHRVLNVNNEMTSTKAKMEIYGFFKEQVENQSNTSDSREEKPAADVEKQFKMDKYIERGGRCKVYVDQRSLYVTRSKKQN